MSISGPITAPGSNPSATFIAPAFSARRLVKASQMPSCIGMRLAQTQVRPAFLYFRGDRSLDRHLDVGVVEDDERRVAAEFEREFLDRAGALLHQQFTDFGRAGEGQLADDRVRGQLAADLLGPAGSHRPS